MDYSNSIILSLFARVTPEGKPCAKNYPFAEELVRELNKKYHTIQIGVKGEPILNAAETKFDLSLPELIELSRAARTFVAVDNFYPHFMNHYFPEKRGLVLFSQSDPKIFGYKQNVNLLKDRRFLRVGEEQFSFWTGTICRANAHVSYKKVAEELERIL